MEKNYSYYDKSYIKFAVMQSCKNREVACIPKARAFKIVSSNSLDTVLKFVNWKTKPVKLYRSIAKLKQIPMFTFNPKLRSSETGPWFKEEFDGLIYEYDLFMDFDLCPKCPKCGLTEHSIGGLRKLKLSEAKDGDEDFLFCDKCYEKVKKSDCVSPDLNEVLKEVNQLTEYLQSFHVPYYVQFSGNRGFQVFIDGQYMPAPRIENKTIQPAKLVSERLRELFDFKYLDLSNNGVGNRLCKIPYSLCPTAENQDEEEMNVALPLSDEQIKNFNIEDMKLKNVYKSINLFNRGVLERNSNLSLDEKKANVRKLIKSLMIEI